MDLDQASAPLVEELKMNSYGHGSSHVTNKVLRVGLENYREKKR